MTSVSRYHPLLVILHWLLAFFIIAALALGALVMTKMPNTSPMKLEALRSHMTGGFIIFVLMSLRLAMRLGSRKPPEATTHSEFLDRVAWASHRLLYLAVFGMVASGIIMALQTNLPAIVFEHRGHLPADFWLFPIRSAHYVISRLLLALIALHIAGALYHTFVLRDGLLRRMFFGRRFVAAGASAQAKTPAAQLESQQVNFFSRFAPWLSRIALAAASLVLVMIAIKYIGDPVGAAAISNTHLDSPLAVTDMRASFGAFPLGVALIALGSIASSRFHLTGLLTVAAVIGSALVVRILGSLADKTFAESRTILLAETVLFTLSIVAIVAHLFHRRDAEKISVDSLIR